MIRRLAFVALLAALGAAAWWAAASTREGGDAPPAARPPRATSRPRDPSQEASITQILLLYRAPGKTVSAARSREETRALAEEILGRVRTGEAMEPLVERYTDDRTEDGKVFNGGTQILVRTDASLPALKRVVFALRPGEVAREPLDTGQAMLVVRRDE